MLVLLSHHSQYLCVLKDAIMHMLTSFPSAQNTILFFLYNCSLPKSKSSSVCFCCLSPPADL